MGERGEIVIVKNGVNPGLVQVQGIKHTSTSISEHTGVRAFVLLLLKSYFRPGVPGGGGHYLRLDFENHV